MQNFMFKSSRGALIFAGIIVLGAVSLVGVEDDPGTVVEATDDINRQKAELDAMIANEDRLIDEALEEDDEFDEWLEEDIEFFDDEELINDAEGFDPAPMVDPSNPDFDGSGEGAILREDG